MRQMSETHIKRLLVAMATGFSLLLLLGTAQGCSQNYADSGRRVNQFGRQWWLSVSNDESRGFLDGYADCTFAEKGSAAGADISVWELSARISSYYEKYKSSRISVPRLADRIDHAVPSQTRMSGGEMDNRPHGYYDGLWWKGASDNEQVGYVEGYLVCLGHPAGESESRKIANAITAWYKKPSSQEDCAIAYVLEDTVEIPKQIRSQK